ncbi:hypothetical protein JCM11641_001560 [Rhodosporidiobolus odoratus]
MADSAQDQVQIPLSTSPLLRLPRELLQHIFDEAYKEEQPPSLLCHTLAPMVIRARWQNVEIFGSTALKLFSLLKHTAPSVPPIVQSFVLEDQKCGTYPYRGPSHDADPSTLRLFDVPTAVAGLSSLQSLHVKATWGLTQYVVQGLEQSGTIFNLRDLLLFSDFDQWEDPLDPNHWAFLSLHTRLKTLTIRVDGWSEGEQRPAALVSPFQSSVTDLTITYPNSRPSPTASAFAAVFPSLTTLALSIPAETPDILPDLLSAFPHPDKVTLLAVDDWCYGTSISHILALYAGVDDLRITGCDSNEPQLFDAIRQMPNLYALEFDDETILTASHLLHLIQGPAKHPSLKLLDLNHIYSRKGASVHDYGPFWDSSANKWTTHAGSWTLHHFTPDFPMESMEEIVEAGRRNGVKVRGSMLEAMKVQKAFEAEEKLVAERWGNAPPPFSPGEMEYYTTKRRT